MGASCYPPGILVTISATYGAGGSVIAPQVAKALGVPFVDRLIRGDDAVLTEGARSEEIVESVINRILYRFAQMSDDFDPESVLDRDTSVRQQLKTRLDAYRSVGGGVVLGWAGVAILDSAFHVRLDGSADARIQQAMRLERLGEPVARARQVQADRARARFVRRLYGLDASDHRLYHMVIDSTKMPIPAAVQAIATAARGAARPTTSGRPTMLRPV